MLKVLIADDEEVVLKGLKHIIDWEALGFTICGEAENGNDTLQKMKLLKPDLVLLDIRMPHLTGLEIIEMSKSFSYHSEFIILSGYSDFSYAQAAVKLGVNNYLLKPVDEDELKKAVIDVRHSIEKDRQTQTIYEKYKATAKDTIIFNFISGKEEAFSYDLNDLNLLSDQYMVLTYEKYNQTSVLEDNWDFAELLRVGNQNQTRFNHITINHQEIILLKGKTSIEKFYHLLKHYQSGPEKGSPLDSIFLAYGRPVDYIAELKVSYTDVCRLLHRRFFCHENQHVLSYINLPDQNMLTAKLEDFDEYPSILSGYIQSHNRSMLAETLCKLEHSLFFCNTDISHIKRALIDIFLQVKQKISHIYYTMSIPFPDNAGIIEAITTKNYLFEIIQFFSEQFELCTQTIGHQKSEDIIEDVIYYINHNFSENLKLESIAPLFGYNSSYLGKVFSQKTGENFNSYLDRIRIDQAKKFLIDDELKVYEIAERIGYKNPDYFHKKFKKYTNTTPAEFRKNIKQQIPT